MVPILLQVEKAKLSISKDVFEGKTKRVVNASESWS